MVEKERGEGAGANISDDVIYKIDVPANRYDLLCAEGIARALLIFLGKIDMPKFHAVENPHGRMKMFMKPDVKLVRPHVVAAVLRNMTFTKENYDSFIDLQDKLHQNICRKRTLVSVGTHDLDTVSAPFYYDAQPPAEIKFRALSQDKVTTANELMELYRSHSQLKQYLHIIEGKPVYPLILDSKNTVMSMPPIINSEHSKITLETKNVLIECASNDLTKAKVVLNTIVAMFSEYCEDKYSFEPVDVVEVDGKTVMTYPDMEERVETVEVDYINRRLGIDIGAERVTELLTKMSLASKLSKDKGCVDVCVPCTRSDILHPCDIMEDVGIAFGFDNIAKTVPKTNTVGKQFPVNKLSDLLRLELATCGFTEVLTFSLLSIDELYTFLRKSMPEEVSDATEDNLKAVVIDNPKTVEYQVARTSLLPGILKTIASNRKMPLPMKLFEISDVVFQCNTADVGAKNDRHLVAVNYGKTPGFELIHGTMDRLMQVLNIKRVAVGEKGGYYVKPSTNASFFPGRCADIFYNGQYIGVMGVLHPEVLSNFDLNMPCACLEITVSPFV